MALADTVKALTFDVFGTVVDWRSGIVREGREFGARHGLDVDWERFADAWRERYQPSLSEVRDGRRPWAKLDVLHRETLVALLDEFGIAGLGEAEIDAFNHAWHRLDPWPDVLSGMARLRRRFVLATLSNGNVSLLVDMARRAGLTWDAVLGAEVARHYKPQAEAYLTTAELLSLAPEQCLMVAAHHHDLDSARQYGFKTAYVDRPQEFGPRPKDDLPAEHGHDIVASDFNDLAHQLGC